MLLTIMGSHSACAFEATRAIRNDNATWCVSAYTGIFVSRIYVYKTPLTTAVVECNGETMKVTPVEEPTEPSHPATNDKAFPAPRFRQ